MKAEPKASSLDVSQSYGDGGVSALENIRRVFSIEVKNGTY